MGAKDEEGELVLLEKIYGCRSCDTAELDDVDFRNGLHDDDQVLEFLVHGRFQKDERDIRGFNAMRWLSVQQLQDTLGHEALTSELATYEAQVRDGISRQMDRAA